MLSVKLVDGRGGRNYAKVSKTGELAISPVEYSETSFNEMSVEDQAYNFYIPRPEKQFVISGVMVFADKDVNDASDTVVIIYEAATSDTMTVNKTLLQFGMGKLTVFTATQLNILVNSGVFVNGKTDDADIHLNILGYYIDKL